MGTGSGAVWRGVVYWGSLESLLALPRHELVMPSISSACDTLSKTHFLTICWVIRVWGPVLLTSLCLCGPVSVCIIITKIGLFSWLLRCASLGFVALGWGCCFSESYLLCLSSSSVPFLPLVLLLCSPLPSVPTLVLGKHICNICVHCGRGPHFISCFICKSFFSFLSLSEKVVAALS